MIPFPDIAPEIFSIQIWGLNLTLRWYALAYILGFILALWIMKICVRRPSLWANNKAPLSLEQADSFLTYLIIGVILGGRIGYILFYNLDFYISHPSQMVRVWDGGMSFHGGFLGVVFAVYFFCKNNKIPLWSGSDLIALATPPGLFLGRIANFINNELWGRPTASAWGVVFPGAAAQNCPQVLELSCARHPTQLYEAFLEGLLLFILLAFFVFVFKLLKRPAFITGIFMIGYGLSRFLVEYVRVPDAQFISNTNPQGFAFQLAGYGLTMGQILSIPMLLFGVFLIIKASATPATIRN